MLNGKQVVTSSHLMGVPIFKGQVISANDHLVHLLLRLRFSKTSPILPLLKQHVSVGLSKYV